MVNSLYGLHPGMVRTGVRRELRTHFIGRIGPGVDMDTFIMDMLCRGDKGIMFE